MTPAERVARRVNERLALATESGPVNDKYLSNLFTEEIEVEKAEILESVRSEAAQIAARLRREDRHKAS